MSSRTCRMPADVERDDLHRLRHRDRPASRSAWRPGRRCGAGCRTRRWGSTGRASAARRPARSGWRRGRATIAPSIFASSRSPVAVNSTSRMKPPVEIDSTVLSWPRTISAPVRPRRIRSRPSRSAVPGATAASVAAACSSTVSTCRHVAPRRPCWHATRERLGVGDGVACRPARVSRADDRRAPLGRPGWLDHAGESPRAGRAPRRRGQVRAPVTRIPSGTPRTVGTGVGRHERVREPQPGRLGQPARRPATRRISPASPTSPIATSRRRATAVGAADATRQRDRQVGRRLGQPDPADRGQRRRRARTAGTCARRSSTASTIATRADVETARRAPR